jgi:type I restriction-modification system DNA methylase subunit
MSELGKALWKIADELRDSMNADDFRDYMLSFLFLRYLSGNYEESAKKELGADYPQLSNSETNTHNCHSNSAKIKKTAYNPESHRHSLSPLNCRRLPTGFCLMLVVALRS